MLKHQNEMWLHKLLGLIFNCIIIKNAVHLEFLAVNGSCPQDAPLDLLGPIFRSTFFFVSMCCERRRV